jgi:hypothetical protein
MSYNVVLNISDEVYANLMQTLKSFGEDEVQIVDDSIVEDEFDEEYYMKHVPPSLIVTSQEEMERRINKALKSKMLTEEEFEKEMDLFMEKLLSEDNTNTRV